MLQGRSHTALYQVQYLALLKIVDLLTSSMDFSFSDFEFDFFIFKIVSISNFELNFSISRFRLDYEFVWLSPAFALLKVMLSSVGHKPFAYVVFSWTQGFLTVA
ncbi:hypothetical protein L6452_37355 [Arctium lappa]|uniref:Uncharacterized protein n=1 Tax=Arctium lappa TaxID=4217 RepID=A0ACB8Y3F4_ARCLA|nr:hypothetical protein L6452_37355 [Arctium lappa]